MSYVVATFYHFADLAEPTAVQTTLEPLCRDAGVCGTLVLADEGINGTIAGSRQGVETVLAALRALPGFAGLEHKESHAVEKPFLRLKLKVKREIVSMGVAGVRPADRVGQYVEPGDWNALIGRDDIDVIDVRNGFEYRVGHFPGAVDPQTTSFTDFPAFADRELLPDNNRAVAMYCTGGIRCEKATSYLLGRGYREVFHLRGGILKYLEQVPEEQSLWQGECFVFDTRVSVKHGLREGGYELCFGCHAPVSEQQRADPGYEFGVSCPYCIDNLSPARIDALRERTKQVELAGTRGYDHLGDVATEQKQRARAKRERKAQQGVRDRRL